MAVPAGIDQLREAMRRRHLMPLWELEASSDLVLTPPWRWHDYGSESAEPAVWLDVLVSASTTTSMRASSNPMRMNVNR